MRRTHTIPPRGPAFLDHDSVEYRRRWINVGDNRYNGAFFYSKEIVKNIIPNVKTDRPWITVNVPGIGCNRAIVFVHNNLHPENYEWLRMYEDLILVCGVPSTVDKVSHLGTAVYLPLSVDVEDVSAYCVHTKTKGTAYVGRKAKRSGISFPAGTDYLENLPRTKLLKAMAQYKKIYAVGRTAIEARILGCEVLPYDPRYPDPSVWEIIDNKDAAAILQEILDHIDGRESE